MVRRVSRLRQPDGAPDVADWSLITFFDKQLARTLNVDWLILASLFVAIYAGVILVIVVAVHFTRPAYRAPWIWPSSDLSHSYVQIAIALTILAGGWLAGFAVCRTPSCCGPPGCCRSSPDHHHDLLAPPEAAHRRTVVAATGGAILVLLVGGRPGCLGHRDGPRRSSPPVPRHDGRNRIGSRPPVACRSRSSPTAWLAGMALVTVVLPATSFYKVAHTIQAASLVKYGQLRLALAVDDREARSRQVLDRQVPVGVTKLQRARKDFDRLGVYDRFFFKTEAAPPGVAGTCRADAPSIDDVPEGLEELLPFYSESSIGLRELTHDRAYDQRWQWCERDGWLLMNLRLLRETSDADPACRSCLDRQPSGRGSPRASRSCWVLAIAAVLVWAVRFIMERVFLIDLIDPLWSARTTGPVSAGANPLMVTRAPLVAQFFHLENYAVIDLGAAGTSDADLEAWEHAARATLGTAEDWKNVLVLRSIWPRGIAG
jgi:hypothetical protein